MAASDDRKTEVLEREVIFTRVFDAPRTLVWKALTDPEHLPRWWGPKGFTNTVRSIDIRTGGHFRFVMHGPNGHDYDNEILYSEVTPMDRMVYTIGDGKGGPTFDASMTLTEMGSRTKVVMHGIFPTKEALEAVKKFGAVEGGESTLECLAEHLGSIR